MTIYFFLLNEKEKTFNILDEDCVLEFKNKDEKIICQVQGEENCQQVEFLIYKIRPDLEKIWPKDF